MIYRFTIEIEYNVEAKSRRPHAFRHRLERVVRLYVPYVSKMKL
jgi:hypothetical protein